MTVPSAVELIAELAPAMPAGFLLGAGTVLDAATAARVIDAGAQFVVSPVFRRAVIAACHERDVPAMPGCFTPDRDSRGLGFGRRHRQGVSGDGARAGILQGLRGPLPQVKLMPTGGVTIDNAGEWIGPARSPSASARRCSTPRRSRPGITPR